MDDSSLEFVIEREIEAILEQMGIKEPLPFDELIGSIGQFYEMPIKLVAVPLEVLPDGYTSFSYVTTTRNFVIGIASELSEDEGEVAAFHHIAHLLHDETKDKPRLDEEKVKAALRNGHFIEGMVCWRPTNFSQIA